MMLMMLAGAPKTVSSVGFRRVASLRKGLGWGGGGVVGAPLLPLSRIGTGGNLCIYDAGGGLPPPPSQWYPPPLWVGFRVYGFRV